MKPHITLAALAVCMCACSSVVPSAVARLYQLTPLEADPADLAVALDLPDNLRVQPGSGQINLTAIRAVRGETLEGRYALRQRTDRDGRVVLDIDPRDHDALRAQQATIRAWENANDDDTSGSISVGFGGCKIGDGPSDSDTLSILLRTDVDGSFFTLVRDASVADVLGALELEGLEPC